MDFDTRGVTNEYHSLDQCRHQTVLLLVDALSSRTVSPSLSAAAREVVARAAVVESHPSIPDVEENDLDDCVVWDTRLN